MLCHLPSGSFRLGKKRGGVNNFGSMQLIIVLFFVCVSDSGDCVAEFISCLRTCFDTCI